jgi:hypothetical protein
LACWIPELDGLGDKEPAAAAGTGDVVLAGAGPDAAGPFFAAPCFRAAALAVADMGDGVGAVVDIADGVGAVDAVVGGVGRAL